MIKLIKTQNQIKTHLPFFAKEIYLQSKSDHYGWFEDDDFILPFTLFKKLIFKRIVFTTEIIYKSEMNIDIKREKEFLNDVISFIKKNKLADDIFKPQPSAVFNTYPDNCEAFKWGSYVIDMEDDLENMIKRVSKSQRNYIRRAIKDGVIVEKTSNPEEIYSLANETLARQNIQLLINKEEFENQYKSFHPKNMLMFKVSYENEIQGTLIIFIDEKNAFAEYAGSIPRPKHGSLKLLHLTAMQYLARNHKLKTYDFIGAIPDIIEGSKEAGIQKFKKEFGASIKEGYQFRVVINPFKYFLFDETLKLYFKLKKVEYEDPVEKYRKLSKSYLKV